MIEVKIKYHPVYMTVYKPGNGHPLCSGQKFHPWRKDLKLSDGVNIYWNCPRCGARLLDQWAKNISQDKFDKTFFED